MPCDFPINVKTAEYPVPCGRCAGCLASRISAWSFRLMQEERVSTSAYFITFTYDTRHVPISTNGYMTLSKRDVQLLIKRIRKAHGKEHKTIKYYAAGEYGTTRQRPHYHIILFNVDIRLLYSVSDYNLLRATHFDGEVQVQCKQWLHGTTSVGKVSGASVGYTLKYINKKYFTPKHKNDDRQKEFSLQSKGIGLSYVCPSIVGWHLAAPENRMYVNLENGKKAAMPRYYKEKIFTQTQISAAGDIHRQRIAVREQTISDFSKFTRDLLEAKKAKQRLHKMQITKDDKF